METQLPRLDALVGVGVVEVWVVLRRMLGVYNWSMCNLSLLTKTCEGNGVTPIVSNVRLDFDFSDKNNMLKFFNEF